MGQSKYLRLTIDKTEIELTEVAKIGIAINYQLESPGDFTRKQSLTSFDIDVPATAINDKVYNTFHNPGVLDLSPLGTFRRIRSCSLYANGSDLLIGKSFMKKVTKQNGVPGGYSLNCYGSNGDWIIDMKEKTLYDILSTCVWPAKTPFSFTFSKAYMESTWAFDGTDETMPFVFAPVKYNGPMNKFLPNDLNYSPETMRPAISIYFVLFWGLRSLGYKIDSVFCDTAWFRRLTMPWTWGNFLDTEGTKYDIHRFEAKSAVNPSTGNGWEWVQNGGPASSFFYDVKVTDVKNNNGAGDYTWDATNKAMVWTYNTPHYSNLKLAFSLNVLYEFIIVYPFSPAYIEIYVEWYHNGTLFQTDWLTGVTGFVLTGPGSTTTMDETYYATRVVAPSDTISCAIHFRSKNGTGGPLDFTYTKMFVQQFKIETIEIPLGSTVGMDTYLQFKNYKWLDFLGGVIDLHDLEINTNPINKTVTIEPIHDYATNNVPATTTPGYFRNTLNWDGKCDLKIPEEYQLYSDYERECYFKFKDDPNDGGLKQIQDRAQTILGQGKYVFPDRFKAGRKVHENRFFAPTCHYDVQEFKAINGVAPQFICILSENIANRSSGESENTFEPKVAYYHGLVSGAPLAVTGSWKWDLTNQTSLPYMYAVNYKAGGQNNPILSYTDENIAGVIGRGLMKRFYLQRLAIMRNGQWLSRAFRLISRDLENYIHREFIRLNNDKWELTEIQEYKPMSDDSTICQLRKWWPVMAVDSLASYPSNSTGKSILTGVMIDEFDLKYERMMRLPTDK